MAKVKKRSGVLQEFDKAKLKNSLKRAGAKEEHATKVADKIAGKVKEGTATTEIWEWCIVELRPLDANAARAYQEHKKPKK